MTVMRPIFCVSLRFHSPKSPSQEWTSEGKIDARLLTSRAGAERVLSSSIGHTTGSQRGDYSRGVVGSALHLVERAGICAVQSSSGAVRGDARRAASGVEIARSSGNECGDHETEK